MLYLLYEWLKDGEVGRYLNVLRYPSTRIAAAGIASLLSGMVLGPRLIERLRFQQHGQSNVREDVPDTHQKKKGTPTMGGALILLCILTGTALFADLRSRAVWVVVLITFGYGLIGFLDDWLKLFRHNSRGLPGRWKLLLQTVFFGLAVGLFLTGWTGDGAPRLLIDTRLTLPFVPTRWFNPDLGWLYVPLAWVLVVGTSNAVNITDGLDGLAIVPTIVSAFTFAVLCYVAGTTLSIADQVEVNGVKQLVGIPLYEYLRLPQTPGGAELAVFCAAIAGAGISFLWFNTYPASVFMGDIGALALGGGAGRAGHALQERGGLGHRSRGVLRRDPLGDDPGALLQDHRAPGVQDGARPSPLRARGVRRAEDHRPVLDRGHSLRRGGAAGDQAEVKRA